MRRAREGAEEPAKAARGSVRPGTVVAIARHGERLDYKVAARKDQEPWVPAGVRVERLATVYVILLKVGPYLCGFA